MRSIVILFCLLFPFSVFAADEKNLPDTLDVTDLVVSGEFKKAIDLTTDETLKKDLSNLLNLNKLVADSYQSETGKEISIHIRGNIEKGILDKIKETTLYVKVKKGSVLATWPVKISTLPIEFRMERAKISDANKNLYFGAKAFRQKNYSAAAYFFKHTGAISKSLLNSADKQSNYIMSLSAACVKGDAEKIKELLKKGADINGDIAAHVKDKKTGKIEKKESTILIETLKTRNKDMIKYLAKNGADINKTNSSGVTPLMFAIMYFPEDTEIVEFLLNHQADFRKKDNEGNTALSGAVGVGRIGAVKTLIKHGSDVNAPNKQGYTPLMLAVASNNADMFKLLLENGADMKKPHPKGWTVFDLDRSRMHPDIKVVLDKLSPPKKPTTPSFPGFSSGGLNVMPKRR